MKTAVIIGAGPAGLTAALELLRHTDVHPVVVEASDAIGGLSRTVIHNGSRMDIGGHRFFSKSREVLDWWEQILPLEGSPSHDGPDPGRTDRVMLLRRRISRILWRRRLLDYPIRLRWATLASIGLRRTLRVQLGFIAARLRKSSIASLEDFYVSRFGRPLYKMFFKAYTEKVWGVHPSRLSADWGSQRVRGLSVAAVAKDMAASALGKKRASDDVETSLIEHFLYPKHGPGQMWEAVADEVRGNGGEILLNSEVVRIDIENGKAVSVVCRNEQGELKTHRCDYLLSTMPIRDLIAAIRGVAVPSDVWRIAAALPYRDFITVGLAVKSIRIGNGTKASAGSNASNRIADTWLYIQEPDVRMGRIQVFNNWSPYLAADNESTVWLGLEYFCSEGDELWNMAEHDFIDMAISELEKMGMIDRGDVLDACQIKMKKAYPAYHGSYSELGRVRQWLDGIENLYCLGRNGQHRYNNMDHSMLTAMECVRCIRDGIASRQTIWNVGNEAL